MKLKRVMIVDDDRFDQLAYRRILRKTNAAIELIPFQYATEALDYLKSADRTAVDAIFLDINMPRMNGFEFLQAAQDELPDQLENETLIMVTTSQNPEDKHRAESFPAVKAFFNKPLTQENIAVIDQLVGSNREE
ncbi:response regulator [Phaeobacter sp. HF9A]|uniref:response regulator n=1 Tax=Phaeobacter sp. HF9A TaxID=2721561 RepID=UPI00142FB1A9|nr:response regulator [Phaeobacter sp. HF9A]NIZ15536.1 response regulator [Phaeobacter sp. HF9A]